MCIARTLSVLRKERRFAIAVSEQVLTFALDLADRIVVLDSGRIMHEEVRSFLTG